MNILRLSDIYKKKGFPLVTLILTILCLVVSIATYLYPIIYHFLTLCENHFKSWQLISCLFVHNESPRPLLLIQLFVNLLGLIPFGIFTEKILGKLRALCIFVIEWLVTIGVYFIFQQDSSVFAAGISSVVYAYATVSFICCIIIWRVQGSQIWKQLLTYFFIVEFLSLFTILNPFLFDQRNVLANFSGIVVGGLFAFFSKKKLHSNLRKDFT